MNERTEMHEAATWNGMRRADEFERQGVEDHEEHAHGDDGRPTESWRLLADQLAPRIEELARSVDGLQAAPYYVWLADTVHLCDPAGDLRVKVEALRWMFRIAKHLSGDVRGTVMLTVSKSLEDLEIAFEAQMRASAVQVAA